MSENNLTIEAEVNYFIQDSVDEYDFDVQNTELVEVKCHVYREDDVLRFDSGKYFYYHQCARQVVFDLCCFAKRKNNAFIAKVKTESDNEYTENCGDLANIYLNTETNEPFISKEEFVKNQVRWDALNEHIFFEDASNDTMLILINTILKITRKFINNISDKSYEW